MREYRDELGRAWKLTINVTQAERVKEALNVDLLNLYGETAGKLFSNPPLFVDVLHTLCRDQCAAESIDPVSFAEGLVGDAIERAADALMDAVADFFPSRKRKTLQAIKTKGKQLGDQMEDQILERIAAMSLPAIGSASLTSGAA